MQEDCFTPADGSTVQNYIYTHSGRWFTFYLRVSVNSLPPNFEVSSNSFQRFDGVSAPSFPPSLVAAMSFLYAFSQALTHPSLPSHLIAWACLQPEWWYRKSVLSPGQDVGRPHPARVSLTIPTMTFVMDEKGGEKMTKYPTCLISNN